MIPPNQMAGYAVAGMLILLIIMDLAYYKNHFPGPQAALNTSMEEIVRREKELEKTSSV
ncbi:MAG: amino acid permease [Paenibacillus sp.]|nr:amino acid permease [Paenibacillus sp.]